MGEHGEGLLRCVCVCVCAGVGVGRGANRGRGQQLLSQLVAGVGVESVPQPIPGAFRFVRCLCIVGESFESNIE